MEFRKLDDNIVILRYQIDNFVLFMGTHIAVNFSSNVRATPAGPGQYSYDGGRHRPNACNVGLSQRTIILCPPGVCVYIPGNLKKIDYFIKSYNTIIMAGPYSSVINKTA